MNTFIDIVNSMFQPICGSLDDISRFEDDMNNVSHEINKEIDEIDLKKILIPHLKINNIIQNKNENIEILTHQQILDYFEKISSIKNEYELWNILDEIVDFALPSNRTEFVPEKNCMNVLIIGGGPNGLFLAYYLHTIYNDVYQRSNIKLNITILENRILSENVRMPFTRNRTFNICTPYLSSFFQDIFSKIDRGFNCLSIQIKYFELLAYIYCYMRDISMIHTKKYETEIELSKFVKDNNINVLFDSTGGRLKITPEIDIKFMNNCLSLSNKLTFRNNRLEYMPTRFNYWCGVEVLDINFKSIRFDIKPEENNITEYIFQHEIKNSDDFNHLTNILIKKEELLYLLPLITDTYLKKEIVFNYNYCMKNENIKYIKMDTFTADMYHKTLVSYKWNNIVYVGVGDTIFHSHFLTGAGLNRTILLSVKIAHLLPLL